MRDRSADGEDDMPWLAGVDGNDSSEEEAPSLWALFQDVEDSREVLMVSMRSSSSEDSEGVCHCMEPAAGCEIFGPEGRELHCTQNKGSASAEPSPLSFKPCQIFSIRKVGNLF